MKHLAMAKDKIRQARALFGPAPILSSEQPELFEAFFEQLALCLRPQDFVEVMLIWHYAVESWRINQAIRHSTVAIERRYQEGVRQKLQRARLQHAQQQAETRAEIARQKPADIAALAELEENALSVADDVDEILKRKATERDHNIAFERSMIFQEQLDKLIASASRRRDNIFAQLELYRIGLGTQVQDMTGQLLDGEVKEITSATTDAPPLAPLDEDPLVGIPADCAEVHKIKSGGPGEANGDAETE